MSAYTVCVVERGALAVVRGYDDQGEASRAMKGVGPTGHVFRGALLHKVHPKMDPAVERKVEQALRDGTHPALPLARLASPPEPTSPAPQAEALAAEGLPLPEPQPAEEPMPSAPAIDEDDEQEEEETEEEALVNRAAEKAGGLPALAQAIECAPASLYSARSGSKPMSAPLRAKLTAYLEEGDEPANDNGADEAPSEQSAEEPTPTPVAPPAPAAPVVSRAGRTVRLELDADTARGFYQVARAGGFDALALRLADALLGGASDRA